MRHLLLKSPLQFQFHCLLQEGRKRTRRICLQWSRKPCGMGRQAFVWVAKSLLMITRINRQGSGDDRSSRSNCRGCNESRWPVRRRGMEVWLDSSKKSGHQGVERFFRGKTVKIFTRKTESCTVKEMIGGHVHIDSETAQTKARSLAGTVEWILLTFEDWSMIPIENILAAVESTPTKIAAQITQPIEAQGAGFCWTLVLMHCSVRRNVLKPH